MKLKLNYIRLKKKNWWWGGGVGCSKVSDRFHGMVSCIADAITEMNYRWNYMQVFLL